MIWRWAWSALPTRLRFSSHDHQVTATFTDVIRLVAPGAETVGRMCHHPIAGREWSIWLTGLRFGEDTGLLHRRGGLCD